CLALAERGAEPDAQTLAAEAARRGAPVVVVEGVADPRNLGAVFRTARAFGAGAVLLGPGGADPLYRQTVRVSLGASLEVPFASCPRWPDALAALEEAGFAVWALCADEGEPLAGLRPSGPVALLLGGEAHGLSPGARARAQRRVRIPVAPGSDSLNVATASGIALYHVVAGTTACAS
ncbi:MAG: RNA methyltransferase, partial [Myxococcota bacterium]|nr:RNA methyltransferase [Myxococcota bacterium]